MRARTASAARTLRARPTATTTTGDLDVLGSMRRTAGLTPAARAAAERAELTQAARSVAKVWLLRHEIEGVEVPDAFLSLHPEARATTTAARGTPRRPARRPNPRPRGPRGPATTQRAAILSTRRVAEQVRTYWCGPSTMQMIAWGWKKFDRGQTHWANRLGTTTAGTAITDMVRVVNEHRLGPTRVRRAVHPPRHR